MDQRFFDCGIKSLQTKYNVCEIPILSPNSFLTLVKEIAAISVAQVDFEQAIHRHCKALSEDLNTRFQEIGILGTATPGLLPRSKKARVHVLAGLQDPSLYDLVEYFASLLPPHERNELHELSYSSAQSSRSISDVSKAAPDVATSRSSPPSKKRRSARLQKQSDDKKRRSARLQMQLDDKNRVGSRRKESR